MALGRRLFDLARTELNALLDRAAKLGEEGGGDADGLEAFSLEELEAEIQRRRLDREIEDRARRARQAPGGAPRPNAGPQRPSAGPQSSSSSRGSRPAARPPTAADKVAKAYAALELKPGADFVEVKSQYRKLMRKYHPDKHAGSPEKEKAAHELTQKLTDAYKTLEQRLRKP